MEPPQPPMNPPQGGPPGPPHALGGIQPQSSQDPQEQRRTDPSQAVPPPGRQPVAGWQALPQQSVQGWQGQVRPPQGWPGPQQRQPPPGLAGNQAPPQGWPGQEQPQGHPPGYDPRVWRGGPPVRAQYPPPPFPGPTALIRRPPRRRLDRAQREEVATTLFFTVGSAIVAMGNRPNPPNRWAAIAGGYKSVLAEGDDDSLRVVQLRDTADKPITFSADPARWRPSFAAAARLQLHLRTSSQTMSVAAGPALPR